MTKQKEVKVGSVYAVKISGRVQPVRIETRNEKPRHLRGRYGTARKFSWMGTNLSTQRSVHIRSAAKLRHLLKQVDGKWVPDLTTTKLPGHMEHTLAERNSLP